MTGKIKWFDEMRGYGFISGSDGVNVFVHISQIENREIPALGQPVAYIAEKTKKGIQAVNVVFLNVVMDNEETASNSSN